jgi:hypothetical protein
MNEAEKRLAALGLAVPEILIPAGGVDLEKWAVIACDQFTQDKSYWEAVKAEAGDAPSCVNLILPELWLEEPGRIGAIRRTMGEYLDQGVFAPPRRCCVYIERSTPRHPCRRGLVIAVDLEQYDWKAGAGTLVRATEGVIQERLPLRMEIRRGASLETPHILLLIDDEDDGILPALGKAAKKQPPLYETPLMMKAGAVRGWALEAEDDFAVLAAGLERLAQKAAGRYGVHDPAPFLYAAGDGNHSLAAAKAVWDEYKASGGSGEGAENHPARRVLVEIENIYDEGIVFEPIHRVIFGAAGADLLAALSVLPGFSVKTAGQNRLSARQELLAFVNDPAAKGNRYGLAAAAGGVPAFSLIETDTAGIATVELQPLLDEFVRQGGFSIDFIHGEEAVLRLVSDPQRPAAGLILPPVKKDGLFKTAAAGPLPRKSFSMGEAPEKRFYLECRRLFA